MTIGERVRMARRNAGLSVRELARKAKMGVSTLYDLERGDQAKTTKLPAIAEATGSNASWLESGRGPAEAPPRTPQNRPSQGVQNIRGEEKRLVSIADNEILDFRIIQYFLDALDAHDHDYDRRLSNEGRARLIADNYAKLLRQIESENRRTVDQIIAESDAEDSQEYEGRWERTTTRTKS